MALDQSPEQSNYYWRTHSAVTADPQPQFEEQAHSSGGGGGLHPFQNTLQGPIGTHGTSSARPIVQVQTDFGTSTTDIHSSDWSFINPSGMEGFHFHVGMNSCNPLSSANFMSPRHNEADFYTPLPSTFLTSDHQAGRQMHLQRYGMPFSALPPKFYPPSTSPEVQDPQSSFNRRPREVQPACQARPKRRTASKRDQKKIPFLVEARRAGKTWKQIKKDGKFEVAETTLGKWYREVTKEPSQRARVLV